MLGFGLYKEGPHGLAPKYAHSRKFGESAQHPLPLGSPLMEWCPSRGPPARAASWRTFRGIKVEGIIRLTRELVVNECLTSLDLF